MSLLSPVIIEGEVNHYPKSLEVIFRFYHSFKDIFRHLSDVKHNEESDEVDLTLIDLTIP